MYRLPFVMGMILLALLTGCASPRLPPSNEQAQSWGMQGKMALRYPSNSVSANIIWQQNANDYTITLFGPMGMGKATIIKKGARITLQHKGKRISAASADELLYRATGWQLPIGALQFWVRGQHSPYTVAELERNIENTIVRIHQDGWTVHYLKRFTDSQRPQKIRLENNNATITLVVKQWR